VDDRIFLWVPVAKVIQHGFHVRLVEQPDHLGNTQLVEVDTRPARLAAPPADLEEGLHQLAQKGVRLHMGCEIVGRLLVRIGDARREQAVGDGLRIHVREAVGIEVMHQRRLECLHEAGEQAFISLDRECRGPTRPAELKGPWRW